MKILKVKAGRQKGGGKTTYTYPPAYDSNKIQVLAYETSDGCVEVDARDSDYEYLIGIVKDVDAPGFLVDPSITEITTVEAKTLGEAWRKPRNIIQNPIIVTDIAVKVSKNETLTKEEKDALDPDKAQFGIAKSKSISILIDEQLAKAE